MFTIVCDTNVYVSAIVFGGKPRQVLSLAIVGELRLALSKEILLELMGVLEGPKFQYPKEMTAVILQELMSFCQMVVPEHSLNTIASDPADNRVLECALAAKADIIVSGDEDLLALKKFQDIMIQTPEQFLRSKQKK